MNKHGQVKLPAAILFLVIHNFSECTSIFSDTDSLWLLASLQTKKKKKKRGQKKDSIGVIYTTKIMLPDTG